MPLELEAPPVANSGQREGSILPLQNGDNLSSREFLRRSEAMPVLKKAELIEGQVYLGSPVGVSHAQADGWVHLTLGTYAARTSGVEFLPNSTVVLDPENTIQPDALLRILPEYGGRSRSEEDYIGGPPELIVEIAASSASIDLFTKFRACQRNGLKEYVVWLVAEGEIRWFILEGERYLKQAPDAQGILSSRTFPGLLLSTTALLAKDAAGALAALEEGLKTPAHAAFVEKLRATFDAKKT